MPDSLLASVNQSLPADGLAAALFGISTPFAAAPDPGEFRGLLTQFLGQSYGPPTSAEQTLTSIAASTRPDFAFGPGKAPVLVASPLLTQQPAAAFPKSPLGFPLTQGPLSGAGTISSATPYPKPGAFETTDVACKEAENLLTEVASAAPLLATGQQAALTSAAILIEPSNAEKALPEQSSGKHALGAGETGSNQAEPEINCVLIGTPTDKGAPTLIPLYATGRPLSEEAEPVIASLITVESGHDIPRISSALETQLRAHAAELSSLEPGQELQFRLDPADAAGLQSLRVVKSAEVIQLDGELWTPLAITCEGTQKSIQLKAFLVERDAAPQTAAPRPAVELPHSPVAAAPVEPKIPHQALLQQPGEQSLLSGAMTRVVKATFPGEVAIQPNTADAQEFFDAVHSSQPSSPAETEAATGMAAKTGEPSKKPAPTAMASERPAGAKSEPATKSAVSTDVNTQAANPPGNKVEADSGPSAGARTSEHAHSQPSRQVEFKLLAPQGPLKVVDGGIFKIQIEPESLGKIRVELKVTENRLVAKLEVGSQVTRQVVEANLPQLKETLGSHGLKIESFVIDVHGEGARAQDQFLQQRAAEQSTQANLKSTPASDREEQPELRARSLPRGFLALGRTVNLLA